VERGERWHNLPGLVYREGDHYHRNPPEFGPLDILPRARQVVDNRRYLMAGGMGNVETKRGCAQSCIYCADSLSKGRRYRLRSPKAVGAELEALLDQGVDWLHLCDAEFSLPRGHAEALCEEIVARGLSDRLRWYAYAVAQPFDERLAALMLRAGCRGINFGVDSGSDEILRRLGRSYTAEDVRSTAAACRKQGLTFMFDLLIGGPGETRATVRETIELMKQVDPARVGAAIGVRIYPGTRLAAMVAADGFQPDNPELHGVVAGNEDFADPVFYLSAGFGVDGLDYVRELVDGDQRFFLGAKKEELSQNYNYNDNSVLVEAIRRGERGAYWDILRRMQTK
ncbi:MAG: radical SAM protein, partial [Chloroflexi bacterium]|nr:radical SAM protein [Chloroflexota bacterium]